MCRICDYQMHCELAILRDNFILIIVGGVVAKRHPFFTIQRLFHFPFLGLYFTTQHAKISKLVYILDNFEKMMHNAKKMITSMALRCKPGDYLLKPYLLDNSHPMFQMLQAMGVHTKKQANDVRFIFYSLKPRSPPAHPSSQLN
jgi:hypothetical protein